MSETRRQLQVALYRYTTDTLIYIKTVREFCEKFSKWKITREKEITSMIHIEDRADKINLNFSHFTKSKEKGKAFKQYTKSKLTQITADSRRAKLEKELSKVLNDTLEGLKKLNAFLDAVEKLAVTSLHVFRENQVLHLPTGISFEHVQAVITAARLICPLLLECKRDTETFFLPKLQNVEVLKYQLNRYIQVAKDIHEMMEKSSLSYVWLKIMDTEVDLNVDLSEDNIRRMLHQIELLDEIRKDPNFQMVFLFQDVSCSRFIKEFNERHPGMLKFLKELEECAAELEKMSKGAKISSVAGSSVGAVGGVLSIVGLALTPVTAGVSLALTMTGVGLGVTSGVNSALTTGAEIGVNRKYQKKANKVLQSFMEDLLSLQDCLQEVTNRAISNMEANDKDVFIGVGKIAFKAATIGRGIDSFVGAATAFKLLKSKQMITSAGKVVAQEGKAVGSASKVASNIPDIGKTATKAPLALSKTARAGLIALNGLLLGMDIFFICKDSVNLAKGSETKVSQFIRARAALWSSEMDSWQKIHDSLNAGLKTSENKKSVLESPIYPVMKKQRHDRQSVSFVEKQGRDVETRHIRGFYLFVAVLGGLLGFVVWLGGTISN